MFWLNDDQLLTIDGEVVDCDICPCEPIAPCCPCGEITGPIYVWGTYYSSNIVAPVGCIPTRCEQNYVVGSAYASGLWNKTFRWGAAFPTVTGTIQRCPQLRFTGVCTDRSSETVGYNLGDGTGWHDGDMSDSTPWPVYSDDHCPEFGLKCTLPLPHKFVVSSELVLWLSSVNPAFGIPVPDGNFVPTDLTFRITLTKGGIPTVHTSRLRYSIGFLNVPFIALDPSIRAFSYSWTGSFTDCNGNCTPVSCYWAPFNVLNPLLDGKWHIYAYEVGGALREVYTGVGFPVAGNTVDNFAVCDDTGNPSPWNLN